MKTPSQTPRISPSPSSSAKRSYVAPRLKEYGKLDALTQGTATGTTDSPLAGSQPT